MQQMLHPGLSFAFYSGVFVVWTVGDRMFMLVGSRLRLVNLQNTELNDSIGVIVSIGIDRHWVELESEFRIAVIVKMLRPDNYGDCCQVVSKADEALKNAERSNLAHRLI